MKKIIHIFALALCFSSLQAQTEIKINPIGALFASPDISVEFAASQAVGIEPFLGFNYFNLTVDGDKFTSTGFGYGAHGKYYFSPEKGIDKFYAGVFLRGGQSKFSNSSSTASTEKFTRTRLVLLWHFTFLAKSSKKGLSC